ncbi:RAD52 family DNA repair protein [Rhodobacter sp. NTK016B]|uniref:RAD52 family DNA repair protein n=1 Tax=Rhodobacter sp. NTK016B TaxID=2759676 RepID=UPI001A8E3429|nr:RAD52 family DNA repair protein [Rhodobacter sp. NTK016B]MBN8292858.1 RAD52 family DNA repair protein [Rhodobacter sp. NTK016B]
MDWNLAAADLSKKLDPAHIKPAKQYGPKGDYIEGWHAMAEANRIFGFGGWSYTVEECTCVHQGSREIGQAKKPGFGVTYTAKVRAVVDGVVREDFGAGHGYDVDCGLAHESAVKEAVTDALKRALRSFGNPFGLALYDKARANVGHDFDPAPFVTAIEAAKTGRELLAAIPGDHADNPAIRAAIIDTLDAIVKGAQNVAQIDAMQKAFAPVWEEVAAAADSRRAELGREAA